MSYLNDVVLWQNHLTSFNSIFRSSRSRTLFSFSISFICYVRRSILFYPIPQSFVFVSYVVRITLAHKCINNGPLLAGRTALFLNGWKDSPSTIKNWRFDSKETFYGGLFNLTFKSKGSVTNPW